MLPRWGGKIGAPGFYKHTAPLGQAGSGPRASTNMLPRWGGKIGAPGFYKHAAPLGQEDWGPGLLQTYCPAGAGQDRGLGLLQTCCPAGAGRLGPRASTNILPRWGRKIGAPGFYKHTAPLGQGRIGASGFYKHAAPLGQERRYR